MKKCKRVISIALAFCVLASSFMTVSYAADKTLKERITNSTYKVIDKVYNSLMGPMASLIPESEKVFDYEEYESENFYDGTGFEDKVSEEARWMLGSAEASIVPDDYLEYDYYLGGYFFNKAKRLFDDICVRAVAISDNTGRGITVAAVTDSIGLTNGSVKKIREMVCEKSNGKYNFSSINITSTHTHSGIDTEGLWTNLFSKIIKNGVKSVLKIGKLETGTDPHYMEFFYETASDTIIEACENMESGTMTYAKKDIGKEYFWNKNRPQSTALITDMHRFVFTPDNENSVPTMMVSMAAHPYFVGLEEKKDKDDGDSVSGDYVYYMGEVINGAGYNFVFFNGAIAGIYSRRGVVSDGLSFSPRDMEIARLGREYGKIALSLTLDKQAVIDDDYLTNDEIEAKERAQAIANDNLENYVLWYEDWTPVRETALSPVLNTSFKEVDIKVTNPLIEMAGKLNLADYDILKKDKDYYIRTEVGVLELGDKVKIVMMPGEVCQDLVAGGASLTADGSVWGKDFSEKTVSEIFGSDAIVFGLMNDAIGYILPDNDFCNSLFDPHYHETISIGKNTASTLLNALEELGEEIYG